jgi:hypothetical protein
MVGLSAVAVLDLVGFRYVDPVTPGFLSTLYILRLPGGTDSLILLSRCSSFSLVNTRQEKGVSEVKKCRSAKGRQDSHAGNLARWMSSLACYLPGWLKLSYNL